VNCAFTKMDGYALAEVVGRQPREFLQGRLRNPQTVGKSDDCVARQIGFENRILNTTKGSRHLWFGNALRSEFYDAQGKLNPYRDGPD